MIVDATLRGGDGEERRARKGVLNTDTYLYDKSGRGQQPPALDCKSEDCEFAVHQPEGRFFRGGKDAPTPNPQLSPNGRLTVLGWENCSPFGISPGRLRILLTCRPPHHPAVFRARPRLKITRFFRLRRPLIEVRPPVPSLPLSVLDRWMLPGGRVPLGLGDASRGGGA